MTVSRIKAALQAVILATGKETSLKKKAGKGCNNRNASKSTCKSRDIALNLPIDDKNKIKINQKFIVLPIDKS